MDYIPARRLAPPNKLNMRHSGRLTIRLCPPEEEAPSTFEANYNHLKLDNFSSLQSVFGSSGKSKREMGGVNKENTVPNYRADVVYNSPPGSSVTPRQQSGQTNVMIGNPLSIRTVDGRVVNVVYNTTTCEFIKERVPLSNITDELQREVNVMFDTPLSRRPINGRAVDAVYTTPPCSYFKESFLHSNISNELQGDITIDFEHDGQNRTSMSSEMNKEKRSSKARVMISDSPEFSQPCFSTSVPFKKTRRRLPKDKDFESNTQFFTSESMSPMSPFSVTDNISDHDHPEKDCVEEDEDFVGHPVIGSDSDEDEVIFPEEGFQTIPGYVSLGAPTAKCNKCNAIMWKEERVNKNVKRGTPEFSLCCAKGQISLPKAPPTPSYMMQLLNDPKKGKKFRRNVDGSAVTGISDKQLQFYALAGESVSMIT
ncbi:hypothetical protein POM88_045608 [Heracleum sosnowskyi]|uniref:Uncharacterized protein n=1 Tax=Heracleum sosnowskyi TaxID=360622 RepID=A0AAD8H602_9APIA|nr:hypothetical protein POM88_045608 [Heracleum sosnowskyi]